MSGNENFKEDVLELKSLYEAFKVKADSFDKNYRLHFYNLIDRYEDATRGYIEKDISNIISFEKEEFQIEHEGYENSWSVDYPIELLLDEDFLISLEAKYKKERAASKEASIAREQAEFVRLKAKYGSK